MKREEFWYNRRLGSPRKAGHKWSRFEEQELAAMWNEGGLPADIADLLERTVSAVMGRLALLRERGWV